MRNTSGSRGDRFTFSIPKGTTFRSTRRFERNGYNSAKCIPNHNLSEAHHMLRIDADAHVLETEETWEYMDGNDRKFRPQIVSTTLGLPVDEYWLVDGTLRLKFR